MSDNPVQVAPSVPVGTSWTFGGSISTRVVDDRSVGLRSSAVAEVVSLDVLQAQAAQPCLKEPSQGGFTALKGPLHATSEQLADEIAHPEGSMEPYLEDIKKDWIKCDYCPKRMRFPCEMRYALGPRIRNNAWLTLRAGAGSI